MQGKQAKAAAPAALSAKEARSLTGELRQLVLPHLGVAGQEEASPYALPLVMQQYLIHLVTTVGLHNSWETLPP